MRERQSAASTGAAAHIRTPFLGAALIAIATTACSAPPAPPASEPAAPATPDVSVLPPVHAAPPAADGGAEAAPPVLAGIDVLRADGAGPLAGLTVGLITNHTGVTRDGRSTIDALVNMGGVRLTALFGPEHGIRGAAQAGERVEGGRDPATGLPVYSLYDRTRVPTPEEMAGMDALVFDMQDVGARFYTYVWTMALAMEAAGQAGLRFVVLDRPNPITGLHVQGNVLDTAFASFLGMYPVATRHGLTAGELARMIVGEWGVDVDLEVVPARNWTRDAWFDETGLTWVPPSPNMPSLESALHYPGTCLFEQTSLSVGRGLPTAFQQIGAPWLDHEELARRMNALALPGVRFEVMTFPAVRPESQSHLGERVPGERRGLRFVVTDRSVYDPVAASVHALVEIRRMHPDRLEFAGNFDAIAGTDRLRTMLLAGAGADEIMAPWPSARAQYERRREPYLLYPPRRTTD